VLNLCCSYQEHLNTCCYVILWACCTLLMRAMLSTSYVCCAICFLCIVQVSFAAAADAAPLAAELPRGVEDSSARLASGNQQPGRQVSRGVVSTVSSNCCLHFSCCPCFCCLVSMVFQQSGS
jgi:hypothetical protein